MTRTAQIAASILLGGSAVATAQSQMRPTEGPTPVSIAVFVSDVDEVDSASQSFVASVYYEIAWRDPRLAHDVDEIWTRPVQSIWNPRLQVVNQQRVLPTFPETVDIEPDGRVTFRQRIWGSFSQPLDLRDFPFDRQSFEVTFVASGYTPAEVAFEGHETSDSVSPHSSRSPIGASSGGRRRFGRTRRCREERSTPATCSRSRRSG